MENEKKALLLFFGALNLLYFDIYLKTLNEKEKIDEIRTFLLGISTLIKLTPYKISTEEIINTTNELKNRNPEDVLREIQSLLNPQLEETLTNFSMIIFCFSRNQKLINIINFIFSQIFPFYKSKGLA